MLCVRYFFYRVQQISRSKHLPPAALHETKSVVGLRYSASGLGVRWVVAIDSTRVRVPARALLFFISALQQRILPT